MGILDWFINRPAHFNIDQKSAELCEQALEKALLIVNPKLKLLGNYRARLLPAIKISVDYLREKVRALDPPIALAGKNWSQNAALRAFFVSEKDITPLLQNAPPLSVLLEKMPDQSDFFCVLDMDFSEQNRPSMSLEGGKNVADRTIPHLTFAAHKIRICAPTLREVKSLIGAQGFEYLLAQALFTLSAPREMRSNLTERQATLHAKLRLLGQFGPGLGSLFSNAPKENSAGTRAQIEELLLEIEARLEKQSSRAILENELETVIHVLKNPQDYLQINNRQSRVNTMNALVAADSSEVMTEIYFSHAQFCGNPLVDKAFILAQVTRAHIPARHISFDEAQYLL